MDLTKLGASSWSEQGKSEELSTAAANSVASFIQDINQHATATSLNDLINASKANSRFASATTTAKSGKPILLSSTAPLVFPSLMKSLDGVNPSSANTNFSKTVQFGETQRYWSHDELTKVVGVQRAFRTERRLIKHDYDTDYDYLCHHLDNYMCCYKSLIVNIIRNRGGNQLE